MGTRAYWLNELKDVIVIEFEGQWTWDDYQVTREEDLYPRLNTIDHPIPHIYDISKTDFLPPDTLSRMREVAGSSHDNFSGELYVVGGGTLLRAVVNTASELFLRRFKNMTVQFADSLDDAYALMKTDYSNVIRSKRSIEDRILTQYLALIETYDNLSPAERNQQVFQIFVGYTLLIVVAALLAPIPFPAGISIIFILAITPYLQTIAVAAVLVAYCSILLLSIYPLMGRIHNFDQSMILVALPVLLSMLAIIGKMSGNLVRKIRSQRDVAVMAIDEVDIMREQLRASGRTIP